MNTEEDFHIEQDLRKYEDWFTEKQRDNLYTARERVKQAKTELRNAEHSLRQVKRSVIEQGKLAKLRKLEEELEK